MKDPSPPPASRWPTSKVHMCSVTCAARSKPAQGHFSGPVLLATPWPAVWQLRVVPMPTGPPPLATRRHAPADAPPWLAQSAEHEALNLGAVGSGPTLGGLRGYNGAVLAGQSARTRAPDGVRAVGPIDSPEGTKDEFRGKPSRRAVTMHKRAAVSSLGRGQSPHELHKPS